MEGRLTIVLLGVSVVDKSYTSKPSNLSTMRSKLFLPVRPRIFQGKDLISTLLVIFRSFDETSKSSCSHSTTSISLLLNLISSITVLTSTYLFPICIFPSYATATSFFLQSNAIQVSPGSCPIKYSSKNDGIIYSNSQLSATISMFFLYPLSITTMYSSPYPNPWNYVICAPLL